jgi:hypothetical protein
MAGGFDGSATRGLPDVAGDFPPALARLIVFAERFADGFVEFLEKAAPTLSSWVRSIEQLPDSPSIKAYEAYFIETGYTPFEARLLAFLLIKQGETLRQEGLAEPKLSSAVSSVVKAEGATTLVISRRAKVLRQALNKPVVGKPMGTACSLAGVGESFAWFRELVERAASGDDGACRELVRISKALTAHLCDPRQKAPSIASSTHELLLELTGSSYTFNAHSGHMTDRATLATRVAMAEPHFDPRPAARRIKRLKRDQAA